MPKIKNKPSNEELLALFHTEESCKSVSARMRVSPNTLREIWKKAFGEEAYVERGRRLQAESAANFCREHVDKVWKTEEVPCSVCHNPITMKLIAAVQIDKENFICENCRCDRACPVCGMLVAGEKGLSFHFVHRKKANDLEHIQYEENKQAAFWGSKEEGEDYVTCLVCGARTKSLAGHLKSLHQITADQYRVKYGSEVLIRSKKTSQSMSKAAQDRVDYGKGETKDIVCIDCGITWVGSKFLASMHNLRCKDCREKEKVLQEKKILLGWESLKEPEDYVTCLVCGYRAESLVSHLQHNHPTYRTDYPKAIVVALNSAIRDKTAIRGVPRSAEFGQKIREAKLLGLTLEDFAPYLETDGTVDHWKMRDAIGCADPTLKRHMDSLGLRATDKYIKKAVSDRTLKFCAKDFEPFKLKNGKVSIAKAVDGLGLTNVTIKKKCRELGLVWAHSNISQKKCLNVISEILGLPYKEEWRSWKFVNPKSGHRFRYDGYFESIGLVTEFQGSFHYTFPNAFMKNWSYLPVYEALRERDRIKKELVLATSDLQFLEVLEDEPYTDKAYLQGRLVELGFLEIQPGGLFLAKTGKLVKSSCPEPLKESTEGDWFPW
jgi:predicted transcriptional regulator